MYMNMKYEQRKKLYSMAGILLLFILMLLLSYSVKAEEPYITLDANGGQFLTGEPAVSSSTYNLSITLNYNYDEDEYIDEDIYQEQFFIWTGEEARLVNDGRVLVGWSTSANGDKEFERDLSQYDEEDDEFYYLDQDNYEMIEKLYALWIVPETYNLTVNATERGVFDDGFSIKTADGTALSEVSRNDSTIVYLAPEQTDIDLDGAAQYIKNSEGKFFDGWEYDEDTVSKKKRYYRIYDDAEITAVWKEGITVTLDANGGTINSKPSITQKCIPYGTIDLPQPDEMEDHSKVFVGWSMNSDSSVYSNTYTAQFDVGKDDITLYAVWKDAVKLHFVVKDGETADHKTEFDVFVQKNSWINLFDESYLWNQLEYTSSVDRKLGIYGWTTTENSDYRMNGLTASSDVTVYPIWAELHTIRLNANGGKWKESQSDSDVYVLEDCRKGKTISSQVAGISVFETPSGMVQRGWAKKNDGADKITAAELLEDDITLYAVWVKNVFVTYDANGGTFNDGETTKRANYGEGDGIRSYAFDTSGRSYTATISDGHKDFAGWSLERNGEVIDYSTTTAKDGMALYAVWKDSYEITYKANGGSFQYYSKDAGSEIVSTTVRKTKAGEAMMMPVVYSTDPGYVFGGWITDQGEVINWRSQYKPKKDMTVTAAWLKAATVTFEYGNNIYSAKRKCYIGQKLYDYMMPNTRSGEKITLGWSTTADGKNPVSEMTVIQDITLYAIWSGEGDNVSVSVHANQGALASYFGAQIYQGYDNEPNPSETLFAGKYSKTRGMKAVGNAAVREGYGFAGWSTSADGDVVDLGSFTPTGDTDLYAKWSEQYYTVTFKNGSLTGEYRLAPNSSLAYFYEKSLYLFRFDYETPDELFVGYSESENGALIDIENYRVTKDVTIYAVWKCPLEDYVTKDTKVEDFAVSAAAQTGSGNNGGNGNGNNNNTNNSGSGGQNGRPANKPDSHSHTFSMAFTVDKPAGFSLAGSKSRHCSGCGEVADVTEIPMVSSVELSSTSFTFNGKEQAPVVTVKDGKGNRLKMGTDYSLTFNSNAVKVGVYSVLIKLQGNYTGNQTEYFTIIPPNATGLKLKAKSKAVQVSWKKQVRETDGYEICYSTDRDFKASKTKTVTRNKTVKLKIKKLKKKKTYYFRIRTYKKIGGKKIYSAWSGSKKVKVKK